VIAAMVAEEKAHVVSLNFDGLTLRALEHQTVRPLVLSDARAIHDYVLGGLGAGEAGHPMAAVVKIWGCLPCSLSKSSLSSNHGSADSEPLNQRQFRNTVAAKSRVS
jgi:hypothetical protein